MNFLAHLYLSRHNDELMIGNFIADSVKGNAFNDYSPGISKGIVMHRAIDSFTDRHPVFLQSVRRLRPKYRKYAGVIIDIFYDHFLAKNWKHYSDISLEDFTKNVHELLHTNHTLLPVRSKQFFRYMRAHNIPMPYAETEGIRQVLTGMAHRAKFESHMEHATNELNEFYKEFEEEFSRFFPEIQKFVSEGW